jgi:MYXO-CTERM domain-containing protein
LTVLGDQAGANWDEWHRRIGYLNYVVLLAAAALAAAWLLRRRRRTQV